MVKIPTLPLRGSGFRLAAVALAIFVIAVLTWGFVRRVPVELSIEPKEATAAVDGKPITSGQKIGFGKKQVLAQVPDYVPYETAERANLFSTIKINVKLRPLPSA